VLSPLVVAVPCRGAVTLSVLRPAAAAARPAAARSTSSTACLDSDRAPGRDRAAVVGDESDGISTTTEPSLCARPSSIDTASHLKLIHTATSDTTQTALSCRVWRAV